MGRKSAPGNGPSAALCPGEQEQIECGFEDRYNKQQ